MMEKTYLGDGAYVEPDIDPSSIKLTTFNGLFNTNTIVLGYYEINKLTEWIRQWREGE